jgi:hypothetical protein
LCSCYFLALFVGSKAYYTVIYFSCKIWVFPVYLKKKFVFGG